MNNRKTALSVAAVGTAVGVVGLVVIASPAGAGEAEPALPDISAEELVSSVLEAEPPALAGSVGIENNLGLPIPGLPAEPSGDGVQVYADGAGKGRLALSGNEGDTTIVEDGANVWVWNSGDRTVLKVPMDAAAAEHEPVDPRLADPATAARDLLAEMRKDSTISVDGTASVAERPVYQLVLTPKPTEKTLLREIRVSVDSATRMPLRLEVLANGQADPALRIGFTEFATGAQDPALFQFTPPAGATVTEYQPGQELKGKNPEDLLGQLKFDTVGEGWDTVLTGTLPPGSLNTSTEDVESPIALLREIGTEVHGAYGTGWLIKSNVGTALVVEDGRFAIGAVPEQVVTEALSK
jgi:outer membrane lipoprotein-sorting protein